MDDFLDGFADLEGQHIQEGVEQGKRDGKKAGLVEGAQLGIQKGYELGVELGYYKGCIEAMRQLQQQHPDLIPAKCEKALQTMEGLIQSFPLFDPHDERLQDLLAEIQGKFKTLVKLMGLSEQLDSHKSSTASYTF